MLVRQVPLHEIVVGERFRKDFGNVRALAESMMAIGLMQPIVITPKNHLIAGERRLRAAEMLDWATITARILDIESVVLGEYAENEFRKDFTASERVAIGRAVEVELGKRHGSNQHVRKEVQNFAPADGRKSREIAAERAGFGNAETYRQAQKVVDEGATELVDAMDAGKVSVSAAASLARLPIEEQKRILATADPKALRTVAKDARSAEQVQRRGERLERIAEIAKGNAELKTTERYPVIYADPPWRFEVYSRDTGLEKAADNHYPTMTLDDIKGLPVPQIAADDAVLFLWATAPMLPEALDVMAAWGFRYKSHQVWLKTREDGSRFTGTGYWFRNQHELLLVGTRGNIPAPLPGTQSDSVADGLISRHSEKPASFAEQIDRLFPDVPKIELFARSARQGWAVWGNEARDAA